MKFVSTPITIDTIASFLLLCSTCFYRSTLFAAPSRAVSAQAAPAVSERLIKSKIIPDQARALAHALKHAVVKPLKKTMMPKKKSIENTLSEQSTTSGIIVQQSPANVSPLVIETLDQIVNETSVDSLESTSPIALTPPPAKPPRQGEESGSSSSAEIHSPPAKPPRHFALYSHEQSEGLIQQTDTVVKKVLTLVDTFGTISNDDVDMSVLRQTSPAIYVQQPSNNTETDSQSTISPSNSENLPNLETSERMKISNDETNINLDSPDVESSINPTMAADEPSSFPTIQEFEQITDDELPPLEITELAKNLTASLFEELEKEFEKRDYFASTQVQIERERQNFVEQLPPSTSFREQAPTLPQSIVTPQPTQTQSTTRPLMLVSLDSGFNVAKAFSPLIDIATSKPVPKVTTSVTIISPPQLEVSSTSAAILSNDNDSDDDEPLNSTSTLMPNSSVASDRSKFLQSSSKESSVDSNDTNLYDNSIVPQYNAGSTTPARSLISDYDNLHGSYGSLDDDNQSSTGFQSMQLPAAVSTETMPSIPTSSSSMSTIYETADTMSTSSTNTITSRTYVSAMSTLNSDPKSGSTGHRLNSDISDEDLVESYEIETPTLTSVNPFRSSEGRILSHTSTQARYIFIGLPGMNFDPILPFRIFLYLPMIIIHMHWHGYSEHCVLILPNGYAFL